MTCVNAHFGRPSATRETQQRGKALSRRRLLATAITALALSLGAVSEASAGIDRTISWNAEGRLSRLGPVSFNQTSFVPQHRMRRIFGKPSRVRTRSGSCQVTWRRHGLTAWFTNFGGVRKPICKQRNAALQEASVAAAPGVVWRTSDRSLSTGDSFETLRGLYPETMRFDTDGREQWSISPAYYDPIGDGGDAYDVFARIVDGRVRAFDLWIGGAGE